MAITARHELAHLAENMPESQAELLLGLVNEVYGNQAELLDYKSLAKAIATKMKEERKPKPIKCYFCDRTVPTVQEAVEADWTPSFFDGDEEICEPVCPYCSVLRLDNDNERRCVFVLHNIQDNQPYRVYYERETAENRLWHEQSSHPHWKIYPLIID
jgi:hypothetical protein